MPQQWKCPILLVFVLLSACRGEESKPATTTTITVTTTTTSAIPVKLDLQSSVRQYLDAQMLVDQERLFAVIPFAEASLEERRAVAKELMERAGYDGELFGWVSGNRLGIVLAKLGEPGEEQVPEISARLKPFFARAPHEEGSAVIEHLAGMLQALGPRAKAAVPLLEEALGGRHGVTVVRVLAAIDPESESVDHWLDSAMQSRDEEKLLAAAEVLDDLDLPERYLKQALAVVLQAEGLTTQSRGAFLGLLVHEGIESRITESESEAVFEFVLSNAEEFSPYYYGRGLAAAFPSHVDRNEERILELTRSENWWVRGSAAQLLGHVDSPSSASVARLDEMAEDRKVSVGRDAVMSLLLLGRFDLVAAGLGTRSDIYRFNVKEAAGQLSNFQEKDLPPRARQASWRDELSRLLAGDSLRNATFDPNRITVPAAWNDSDCPRPESTVMSCAEALERHGSGYVAGALVTRDGRILLWVPEGELLALSPDLRYDAAYSCEANHALRGHGSDLGIYAMTDTAEGGVLVMARRSGNAPIPSSSVIVRLRRDGTADERFGANAPSPIGFGNYPAVAIDAGGRIYLAGEPGMVGGERPGSLVRLLPDGRIDDSFPKDTVVPSSEFRESHRIRRLVSLPDGRLFLSGWLRTFRGSPLEWDWLVLWPDGNPDPAPEWEDPQGYLSVREHSRYTFPSADRGLFVTRERDHWSRIGLTKVWAKGEEARSQPEILLKNRPSNVREPPGPSLSSVSESPEGDLLVAGAFTHVTVDGRERRADGIALIREGKRDLGFLDQLALSEPFAVREGLDARIVSSGEIVFVARARAADQSEDRLVLSRLSREGRPLEICRATPVR